MLKTDAEPQAMEVVEIGPQEGPQTDFLSTSADIAIFGGSAGGGKTWGLLLEPLRHVYNPDFGAVIFRRTYPEITREGGMWDESERLYPILGGTPNEKDMAWEFPSGARVAFSHMQHEKDKYKYKGAQIPFLGWDQLEDFTENQFWYMLSRNRSTCGVRPYVRGTVNPDPESFVAKLIAWWIDPEDGYAVLERSGRIRWFIRAANEELIWADRKEDLLRVDPDSSPKSLTFILSIIYDNQILLDKDPAYLANLKALPLVDRERLLGDPKRGGNWKIKPSAGKVFDRAWFNVVRALPAGGVECRFWDLASTKKQLAKSDPDYTASCKTRKTDGLYTIVDATAEQLGPAEVDRTFVNVSRQDAAAAAQAGVRYMVRWEIEPGSAGIREARRMVQMLDGIDAKGIPAKGDKYVRAKPLAAQAEAGNVQILHGRWNERWLEHMHHQPDWPHDDEMDAASGSHSQLATEAPRKATSHQG
jgi:predicted phage terminase large subunit-like protein